MSTTLDNRSPISPRMKILQNLQPEHVLKYLQKKKIIATEKSCSCGHSMSLKKYNPSIDGAVWRCENNACKKRISVRNNTFLQNSKLNMGLIFHIVLDFISELPLNCSKSLNGIGSEAAVQWYQYCRDICSAKLLKDKCKPDPDGDGITYKPSSAHRKIRQTSDLLRQSHSDESLYRGTYNMTCDKAANNFELFLTHIAEIYPQK